MTQMQFPNDSTLEIDTFDSFIKEQAVSHGITYTLVNNDHVDYCGIKCNGFFCCQQMSLAVATGKSIAQWLPTLVHEYSHMTQWIDGNIAFKNYYAESPEPLTQLKAWWDLEITLALNELSRLVSLVQAVELDCEKRAVDLIRSHKLPLNTLDYIKQANAYIYFYKIVEYRRRWYEIGSEPYNVPDIWQAMPTNFDNDYNEPPKVNWELCFQAAT